MKTTYTIFGGGFAGLTLASQLSRKLNPKHITLISNRDYFVFSPTLHEVATLDEELAGIDAVKQGIALDYNTLETQLGINVIKSQVLNIDLDSKKAQLDNQVIDFRFGFLALGSKNHFYNIPGAATYALPLKTLPDALKIRSAIEVAIQSASQDVEKKLIRIVIAGGGYTGVELAGELVGFIDFVCWKNHYPKEKVEILIVEAGHKLLKELGVVASGDIAYRLAKIGVRVSLDSRISEVSADTLSLANGERIAHDVLVWAMGIKPETIPLNPEPPTDPAGKLLVNSFLQLRTHPFMFVLGDMVTISSPSGQTSSPTARSAIHQARYVAQNFPKFIKNQKVKPYKLPSPAYLVSVGGKWTVFKYGRWYFKGRFFYLIKNLVHLAFYLPIIGIIPALRIVYFQHKTYILND